jgi:hypothetical protein
MARRKTPPGETKRNAANDSHARGERLIAAMLSCRTMAQACEAAGMSLPTAWRLRQTEEFQQRFKQAKDSAFECAVNGLHDCAVVFVQALRAVCEDPTARGSEKATAARSGLDVLIRSREMLDLSERIAALEKIAGAANNNV